MMEDFSIMKPSGIKMDIGVKTLMDLVILHEISKLGGFLFKKRPILAIFHCDIANLLCLLIVINFRINLNYHVIIFGILSLYIET